MFRIYLLSWKGVKVHEDDSVSVDGVWVMFRKLRGFPRLDGEKRMFGVVRVLCFSLLWGSLLGAAFFEFGCESPVSVLEPCPSAGICSEQKNHIETRLRKRACPDQYPDPQKKKAVSAFTGIPCDSSNIAECTQDCVPQAIPSQAIQANTDFFNDCAKPEVLCVGPGKEAADLDEAAKQVASDAKITKILIAKGEYKNKDGSKPITFQNLQRDLEIEGESNDPVGGSVIVAIEPTDPKDDTYAALRFLQIQGTITLRRLVLKGRGHGVYASDVIAVNVTNEHCEANLRTGMTLLSVSKSVTIEKSRFLRNGAEEGEIGGRKYSCGNRFGIEIRKAKSVSITATEIARNGAGGLLISSDLIGVNVTNEHRCEKSNGFSQHYDHYIINDDAISVNVTNEHRVALKNNYIHHNGPIGRMNQPVSSGSCSKCPSIGGCQDEACCDAGKLFCDNATLHRKLALPVEKNAQGEYVFSSTASNSGTRRDALLGIGAVIAGAESVELVGNSIVANDTMGLMLFSIQTVTLQENALDRNGVRVGSSVRNLSTYAFPALRAWGIDKEMVVQENLILNNVQTGVEIVQSASHTKELAVRSINNHYSGNGVIVQGQSIPQGDGLRLVQQPQQGGGIKLLADGNYFSNNWRTGLFGEGKIYGEFTNNLLFLHPGRAVLLYQKQQTAPEDPQNPLRLLVGNVEVDAAVGVGIQFFNGGNVLPYIGGVKVQNLQTGESNPTTENGKIVRTADAINITNINSGSLSAVLHNNELTKNQRAGIYVEKASATVSRNVIQNSSYKIVKGAEAKVDGSDSGQAETPKEKLINTNPTVSP